MAFARVMASMSSYVRACIGSSAGNRCQLTRRPWGRTFIDPSLTQFTLSLFAAITAAWRHSGPTAHIPSITLSRYDLFHAHLVLIGTPAAESHPAQAQSVGADGQGGLEQPAGLSLVFHSMETPAHHAQRFPLYLGHCQVSSDCATAAASHGALRMAETIAFEIHVCGFV